MAGDSGPWEDYAKPDSGGPWQDYAPASQPTAAADTTKPITAPKASDFLLDAGTIPRLVEGAGQGVVNLGQGILNTVMHPINTAEGAVKSIRDTGAQTYKLAKQGQYVPAVATAMKLAGFDEPAMAREWNQGEGARAVGEAVPSAIMTAYGAEKALGRGPLTVHGVPVADTIPTVSLRRDWNLGPVKFSRAPTGLEQQQDLGAFMNKGYEPVGPFGSAAERDAAKARATFMNKGYRLPSELTAGEPESEGPIGSNPMERQVQTLMQKAILTPEEQATVERILGPNARMRSGEGLTKWRSRVTGGLKAARARTE